MILDLDLVEKVLARHPIRHLSADGRNRASVLVPLFRKKGEDYLLFTRRTDDLRHHRGEISFPGGERDRSDTSLRETALREAEEEIGLSSADVRVLGRLDDFVTPFGFHVTPYVGSFSYPYPFQVSRSEVAEILEIPLRVLTDPGIFRCEDWIAQGRSYRICFFNVGSQEVWGLTGGILRQFLDRIAKLVNG